MESFEQVLDQFRPMIFSVLRRAKVYKDFDYYEHCATVALWEAWRNYNPEIGDFAPYAYRVMLTTIYSEMTKENRFTERHVPIEKDKLTILSEHMERKNAAPPCSSFLCKVRSMLTKEEYDLLMDLYHHRYKYEELTHKYGASIYALKKRRDRIMARLRKQLKKT